jgi:hypothetical protein
MNVEIGAEAAQFPEKEYINGIAVAVWCAVHNVVSVPLMGANAENAKNAIGLEKPWSSSWIS